MVPAPPGQRPSSPAAHQQSVSDSESDLLLSPNNLEGPFPIYFFRRVQGVALGVALVNFTSNLLTLVV